MLPEGLVGDGGEYLKIGNLEIDNVLVLQSALDDFYGLTSGTGKDELVNGFEMSYLQKLDPRVVRDREAKHGAEAKYFFSGGCQLRFVVVQNDDPRCWILKTVESDHNISKYKRKIK